MDQILQLLEKDCRLTPEQLALKTGREAEEIKATMRKLENEGVILGYKALIDWDKTDREYVSAVIEVKVVPQPDRGFDKIAEKIYHYDEVRSVYLMSGSYDLQIILEGRTLREVAQFVAMKLAPLEYVTSTATHFVLRKYKDMGVIYEAHETDERGSCEI
jgi:DNA-binding Lrp family transcriptional regulator